MLKNARHKGVQICSPVFSVDAMDRNVEMHAVARLVRDRLGGEIRRITVCRADAANRPLECGGIIGRRERITIAEVDLHLAGALLVVGRFGCDPHLNKRVADISAQVFPCVQRVHIHVARLVDRLVRLASALVLPEYVELHLRAEFDFDPLRPRFLHRLLEHIASVPLKGGSVRIDNVAEHAADSSVRGSPGNDRNGGGIRLQKEIAADIRVKSCDRRSVDGDPELHGSLQLPGHDRDILLCSEHVKICQPYKLNVILFNIFPDLTVTLHYCFSPFLLTAAITSPAKSGCARLGLDLNSGCPCVPI